MTKARFNPEIHDRRSIRLRGYDYTHPGIYFVTICTKDRKCLFGEIRNGQMQLNGAGVMVKSTWDEISTHYPNIRTDTFIVMLNHIHGIMIIVGATPCGCPLLEVGQTSGQPLPTSGQPQGVAPTGLSLSDGVHRFKTMTTRRYVDGVKRNQWPPFPGKLWQRNYYEHIVRDWVDLHRIRRYILNNPIQWELDALHPS
jgi:REP element-mobilizing transposase RayT